jgi:hypothetical protein
LKKQSQKRKPLFSLELSGHCILLVCFFSFASCKHNGFSPTQKDTAENPHVFSATRKLKALTAILKNHFMKGIFFVSLFVICSINLLAQKDRNKIEATVVGFFNGLSLVNADTLKFYATPDFQLLEDGQVWNMDTLINKIMPRKNSKIERVNTFEFIRTEQSGNMAWVSYNNSAEFRLGEKHQIMRWLESAVLTKRKGNWKIQLLHSTKLK